MDKKAHYRGHRRRLKQKFQNHPEALSDYEVLELLLFYCIPRKDTKPIAKALLKKFLSLKGILLAREFEIEQIEGTGPQTYLFFKILREFILRMERESLLSQESLTSPIQVFKAIYPRIGSETKESFWLVLLNTRNKILSLEKICEGSVDRAVVYPREIFEKVFKKGASAIILIHNHPGGDPTPSSEDLHFTRHLKKIGEPLNIRILDHLIIAGDRFISMKERGEI